MREPRFETGSDFEIYCGGFSAASVRQNKRRAGSRDFSIALIQSINSAVRRGCTEKLLKNNRAYFLRLFCEVRQQLPKYLRKRLHIFITLGTPVDDAFGGDFVFTLDDRIVFIDSTLDIENKELQFPWVVFFTQYHLNQSVMVQTAREIATMLRDGYGMMEKETFLEVQKINVF